MMKSRSGPMNVQLLQPGPSPWPEPKGEALPDTFAAAIGAEAAMRQGKDGELSQVEGIK